MDISTFNFNDITFNASLLIAVVFLWREISKERQKRDDMYAKFNDTTSKTLSEFAGAMRAQSESITSMHTTLLDRVLSDTKTSPPRDRDARIGLAPIAQNGTAGD